LPEAPLPLLKLLADIDYGTAEAFTTYGVVGVKTWVYKGEILEAKKRQKQAQHRAAEATA
jgi:small subunit ribosomal protein S3